MTNLPVGLTRNFVFLSSNLFGIIGRITLLIISSIDFLVIFFSTDLGSIDIPNAENIIRKYKDEHPVYVGIPTTYKHFTKPAFNGFK